MFANQGDNKYLSVQLEQPSPIEFSCDLQFCSTFAVSRKNGQNIAALVSSRSEYENLGKDRYCLNLLDVLSRLFEVSLAAIFENETLCDYFNQEEIIQDQLKLLQDCSSLDQARLEQKTYMETVSKGPSMLSNNFNHQIYPSCLSVFFIVIIIYIRGFTKFGIKVA